MSLHGAYEKIKPYLIRIDSERGFGTGFLLDYNKDRSIAAIATAAHVVKHIEDWHKSLKLWHYHENKYVFIDEKDRIILYNTEKDGATIFIRTKFLPSLPSDPLPIIDISKHKKIGVEVAWVGFPAIVPNQLCLFSGKISSFLDNEDCYLIDGVAINGVSGGPVFDVNDSSIQIIGNVSAYLPSLRPSDTLPGLLRAQDVTPFHDHIKQMRNFDKEKEKEKKKELVSQKKESDPSVKDNSGDS